MQVPLTRPYITKVEEEAVMEVLRSGWLAPGPANDKFEHMFANYLGVSHAVTLNSCASALFAALFASNIRGEVLIPSFTWCATANAVVAAGATPVWVDIEPENYGMDPKDIEAKITPQTEAIIVVHYAGHMCEIDTIAQIAARHGLLLIEDSAETLGGTLHGRQAGSFGIGCFSFFATKNITTGEGGMLTTNDPQLARTVRTMARHGVSPFSTESQSAQPPWHREACMLGYNFRMPGILAALGLAQFSRLEEMNTLRRHWATLLNQGLSVRPDLLKIPTEKVRYKHVYQMYVIEIKKTDWRDKLVFQLRAQGVEASVHFFPPVHLQAYYQKHAFSGHDSLPVTLEKASSVISLPLCPQMEEQDVDMIVKATLSNLDKFAQEECKK